MFIFFQAEDGIRDLTVTGVQTCALPISSSPTKPWLEFLAKVAAAEQGLTRCSIYTNYSSRSEEHTSELQSQSNLVCRLLLEKKKKQKTHMHTSKYVHVRRM